MASNIGLKISWRNFQHKCQISGSTQLLNYKLKLTVFPTVPINLASSSSTKKNISESHLFLLHKSCFFLQLLVKQKSKEEKYSILIKFISSKQRRFLSKTIWTLHKYHVLWPNFIDHDCRLQSWFWLWFLVTIYFDTGNKLSSHLLHHYFLKACQFDNFNIQWQQMTTKVPLKDWIITPLHQQTKL